MLTSLSIQDFLDKVSRGELDVSPASLDEFMKDCRDAASKQLKREKREWYIRMSGLGRPMCQQLLDRDGVKEDMEYNAVFRFLFGDMTEAALMLVLKEAGVDVTAAQEKCSLHLNGYVVRGTLDLIIRGSDGVERVWDIKSASDWAFKNKYKGGYEKLLEEDPFGYIMQGYLYSEAMGMPFGGWLVVNKSSGEILEVPAPDWQDSDRKKYLADAEQRIKVLLNPDSKVVKFEPEDETYRRKGEVIKTGNKVLPRSCGFCGYRAHCWPDAILHDKVTSQAKSPPRVWYTKLKKKEL
jgi:hypothetical protein